MNSLNGRANQSVTEAKYILQETDCRILLNLTRDFYQTSLEDILDKISSHPAEN